MDKKGFWALLASMSKAWKTIFTRTNDSFRYRQAAGSSNSSLPEKNGRAVIDKIYGNTVKWNQLIASNLYKDIIGTVSTENGYVGNAFQWNGIQGHKYFFKLFVFSSQIDNYIQYQLLPSANWSEGGTAALPKAGEDVMMRYLFTASRSGSISCSVRISGHAGASVNARVTKINIIDLTAMGIDNLTTVADVEAWLALNVGEQDYYPYDEGSLISFKGQGVRTIKDNVELDRLDLDVTKIYGKVNGQGSYVQCYPNGMKSAGVVHDILTASEVVVKISSVDLGTLSWSYNDNFFYANIPSNMTTGNYTAGILCSTYVRDTNGTHYTTSGYDKIIGANITSLSSSKRIFIKDTSHTSAPTAQDNWLSGVMLNYFLQVLITYTDLIYSEDGGVTGIPLKELVYKVDKYSTEELLVPASADGSPTSTAIVADIDYQKKG